MDWRYRGRSSSDGIWSGGAGAPLRRTAITTRTTQSVVRFSRPFLLPGFDLPQPPGDYRVDHDEQQIDGISLLAWHRTGAFIYLPALGTERTMLQMISINPADLEAAIEKDQSK